MADGENIETGEGLAEERLRLEREALQVERERLEAARAHLAAEARLATGGRTRQLPLVVTVSLLVLLAFAGGLMTGVTVMEGRQQRQREARLEKALSHLSDITTPSAATNSPVLKRIGAKTPDGGTVSVLVIQ